jgi:hypothetical protein
MTSEEWVGRMTLLCRDETECYKAAGLADTSVMCTEDAFSVQCQKMNVAYQDRSEINFIYWLAPSTFAVPKDQRGAADVHDRYTGKPLTLT